MALLNVINIGFVMVLINIKKDSIYIPYLPIFGGEYEDATPTFFRKIGNKIIITMILMLFTIHGSNMAFAGCCSLKRRCDRGCTSDSHRTKTLTQFDYEDMNTGIEFSIDYRYANLLTWLFVVIVYGTGMPILYPIGALNFLIGYWIDKYLLLTHYRKPPMFMSVMIINVIDWFKYALFARFIVSLWVFSNDKVFPIGYSGVFYYMSAVFFTILSYLVFRLICVPCCKCCNRVLGDKMNTV